MKILFLDIDGVINTMAELGFELLDIPLKKREKHPLASYFDPRALYYLHRIVEETKCKIVLSSTWRIKEGLDEIRSWFDDPLIANAIIDVTPSLSAKKHPDKLDKRGRIQRGEEIYYWLQLHPEVTKYAVLDDDSDMDAVRHAFFQTDVYDGLTYKIHQEVIKFLNNQEYINHYRLNIQLNNLMAEIDSCINNIEQSKIDNLKKIIVETLTELIDKK